MSDAPTKSKYLRYIATFKSQDGKVLHRILSTIFSSTITTTELAIRHIDFQEMVDKEAMKNGVLRKDVKIGLVEDMAFQEMMDKST